MLNKNNIAHIINVFLSETLDSINPYQANILGRIANCRTAVLGGHWQQCTTCKYMIKHYNSCGFGSCPTCQGVKKEKWILQRSFDLLPVKYFHCVFTIPRELRLVFYLNQKTLYDLLHQCVQEVLLAFGKDPRQKIEGLIGGISILHTWTQQMRHHPHIHTIVPAGGLSKNGEWRSSKGKDDFLFSVKAMSSMFRGKLLANIHELVIQNKLILPYDWRDQKGNLSPYYKLKDKLYKKDWVVYSKEAFAGPKQVLEYLARYTHKICITNYRILKVTKTHVTFKYYDRKKNVSQTKTITGKEFLILFSKHILPKWFRKIRHFGFLSTRSKHKHLIIIRKSLNTRKPKVIEDLSSRNIILMTTGKDIRKCPSCDTGEMCIVGFFNTIRGSPLSNYNPHNTKKTSLW